MKKPFRHTEAFFSLLSSTHHNGDLEPLIQWLKQYPEDVHLQNAFDSSALKWTLDLGFFPAAKLLVERGADVHFRDQYGHNALFFAIQKNSVEMVETLLKSGARPDIIDPDPDRNYTTTLSVAALYGNPDIMALLLEYGGSSIIDFQDSKIQHTALHSAVNGGWLEVVKVLVEHGANSSLKSRQGLSALDLALELQLPSIVDYLSPIHLAIFEKKALDLTTAALVTLRDAPDPSHSTPSPSRRL